MTQRIDESKRWKLVAWLILPWDQLTMAQSKVMLAQTTSVKDGTTKFFHLVGYNHPSIWRLIDCLKQQDELGNPPKKKTKRIYFQLQQRLRNLCIQYGEGTRSLEEFLRGVGGNIRFQLLTIQYMADIWGRTNGKPRSASEGRIQLDGGFLKNEAIHCYKHKSHCQIEPMKITLPSYCEPTRTNYRQKPTKTDKKADKYRQKGGKKRQCV
jgi:hypothetical protein